MYTPSISPNINILEIRMAAAVHAQCMALDGSRIQKKLLVKLIDQSEKISASDKNSKINVLV
jgi:hypothetical protein